MSFTTKSTKDTKMKGEDKEMRQLCKRIARANERIERHLEKNAEAVFMSIALGDETLAPAFEVEPKNSPRRARRTRK